MMVETILESSQDFGMSNGSLPQWKRELLQRRAARSRPAAAPVPPPPPPPPPADDDEELRYGPGIVKRLKSRYLSLALRDAPRRRPSVLRRAASLEHLLDERPPPAPRAPRPPRPASLAAPAPLAALAAPARRDSVKRARSVDALSRLEARDEPAPPSPSPPPPAPRPGGGRAARPPRRPAPLLRDAERPPPDVVRSALRKFESAPTRRAAPAARVSAVLRGLEGARRSVTPDRGDDERSPSPPPDAPPPPTEPPPPPPAESPPPASPPPAPAPSPPIAAVPATSSFQAAVAPTVAKIVEAEVATTPTPAPAPAPRSVPPATPAGGDEPAGGAVRAVSRAALEGIARAGSSVRYAFEAARGGSHLPPLAAANPVLVARRVGVIRPMPAPPRRAPSPPRKPSPPPPPPAQAQEERLDAGSPERALVNGHSTPEPRAVSRIGAAGIERAWSGSAPAAAAAVPWARAGAGRARAPPASTSVVFNFSDRKEVPDYIENDGIILRAARRNRIKAAASEPGVVVLRPAAGEDSADEADETDDGPPSPCAVRFVNDNVLINGRSSMPPRPLRDPNRSAKLKLQFDESLTRTFEYPSETSLCEDSPSDGSASPALPATSPAPAATSPAPAATSPAPEQDHNHDQPPQLLVDNTHIASAVLSRYTPSKTAAGAFQLGVAAPAPAPASAPRAEEAAPGAGAGAGAGACGDACACACGRGCGAGADACGAERHAVPCGADAARAWSDARCAATDLLF